MITVRVVECIDFGLNHPYLVALDIHQRLTSLDLMQSTVTCFIVKFQGRFEFQRIHFYWGEQTLKCETVLAKELPRVDCLFKSQTSLFISTTYNHYRQE